MKELSEEVCSAAMGSGADIVGFAPVERLGMGTLRLGMGTLVRK
jgi:hypothetical protein